MILNLMAKAKDLFFNNKTSGLSATNVQSALDETVNKIKTNKNTIEEVRGELGNYLPLSGGLMNKDAIIEVPHPTDTRKTQYGISVTHIAPDTGTTANGYNYKDSSGNTLGTIGAYINNKVIRNYFFGLWNNPILSIYPDGGIEKGYFKRTALSTQNIDTLLTSGHYMKANVNGLSGVFPENWASDAFTLDVEVTYESNRVIQEITGIFQRKKAFRVYTGTWSEWQYYETSGITLWKNTNTAGLSETTIDVNLGSIRSLNIQYIKKYYANAGSLGLAKATTGKIELNSSAEYEHISLERLYPRVGFLGGLRDIVIDRKNNKIIIKNGVSYDESFNATDDSTMCVPTKIIGYYYE